MGNELVLIFPNVKPSFIFYMIFVYRLQKFSQLGQATWNHRLDSTDLVDWSSG